LLVSTFVVLNKSRYKNKCGGDLSPNMMHDTVRPAPSNMPKTGPSRPTKGSAGPPRPVELLRRPVQLFFIHHAGLLSHLPIQINYDLKFQTPNHNAKKGLALHALS
jgi:hypothetical protein